MAACVVGNADVVESLLDASASAESVAADGSSPLLLACEYAGVQLVDRIWWCLGETECVRKQRAYRDVRTAGTLGFCRALTELVKLPGIKLDTPASHDSALRQGPLHL